MVRIPNQHLQPQRPKTIRAGFSLIEVLIALALTVLLLSAVYSAVGMHLRFQTAGRGRVQQGQLLRAVIRKIDEDFGAIVLFVDQSETATTSSSVENPDTLDDVSDTALTVGGLESSSAPITFGIVGTAEFMHLCVSRPLRDLSYDSLYSESATSGRSNDLLTVTYGVGPIDINMLIDPTQPKYDTRETNLFLDRPMTGFGRRAIDLYAFSAATDFLESNHVLAPEITSLSFAYFDGTAWLDSWDSRTLGALPRAVRVTFGFWQGPGKSQGRERLLNVSTGTTAYFDHIFHVPLAIPIL